MESFFSRYKNGLVLLAVLLAQLIGLALQVRRPLPDSPDSKPVRLLRYWMVSVVSPPARASHGAGRGVRDIWSNYIALRNVREQNLDLQAQVERLRLQEGAIAEDARQGQRLQQLLSFKERYIYKTVTAQVIGTAGSDRARLLIIDKGSRNGLALDMPVITPDGIVGKVREVFPNTAHVLEISDQSSGAGVMLETTRIRGVLRGNAFGQPQIINILPDDRIKPGEKVVTSGGDQIYPRGLPVGIVDHVANDPERNPYIDVVVKPDANLSRLEEVLVITTTGDQLPPGAETDLARSEAEAQQHSAAEVLSEKLPSIREANADGNSQPVAVPPSLGTDAAKEAAAKAAADAARPLKPPPPLHPDRFTPGASLSPSINVGTPVPHRAGPSMAKPTSGDESSDQSGPRSPGQLPMSADPSVTSVPIRRKAMPVVAPATEASTGTGSVAPSRSAASVPATQKGASANTPPNYVEPYFVKRAPTSNQSSPTKTNQRKSVIAKPPTTNSGQTKSAVTKNGPGKPGQANPAQAKPSPTKSSTAKPTHPEPSAPPPQGAE